MLEADTTFELPAAGDGEAVGPPVSMHKHPVTSVIRIVRVTA
jgi:hypothetical protein